MLSKASSSPLLFFQAGVPETGLLFFSWSEAGDGRLDSNHPVIDQGHISQFAAKMEKLIGVKSDPILAFGIINDPMENKFDQTEENRAGNEPDSATMDE